MLCYQHDTIYPYFVNNGCWLEVGESTLFTKLFSVMSDFLSLHYYFVDCLEIGFPCMGSVLHQLIEILEQCRYYTDKLYLYTSRTILIPI